MTGRDRLVALGIGVFAVLAAVWLLAVSPERKQAAALGAQVSVASAQLATAESQVASARSAEKQYPAAYSSIVSLGKAVPTSQEVPALIYQIAQASNQKHVEFASISSSATGSPSAASGTTATSASSAASTAFTQMPFTFIFNGTFPDLSRLFEKLDASTGRTATGALKVSGRLLTVQSVKLSPGASTPGKSTALSGNISAVAYVLGAEEGSGATAAPSTGAGLAATPPSATSTGSAGAPTTPAIVRVTP
jgi:Tfp pilus assembly protein PilO